MPKHVDGYFAGYSNHSIVLLVYDAESHTVKQIHREYVDTFNVRTHNDEELTPNSVILQDMPASVPNLAGGLIGDISPESR